MVSKSKYSRIIMFRIRGHKFREEHVENALGGDQMMWGNER